LKISPENLIAVIDSIVAPPIGLEPMTNGERGMRGLPQIRPFFYGVGRSDEGRKSVVTSEISTRFFSGILDDMANVLTMRRAMIAPKGVR